MSIGLPSPINFSKWVTENGDKLKPPVNNFCIYDGKDFITMVVGGPNSRNDYHLNETEEWFYQVKGNMLLKVISNESFIDIKIDEGEMFLLPANTPHNPCRFENTIGLVMERKRPEGSIDRLRWYCQNHEKHSKPFMIREVSFHCTDLGTQLKPLINEWMENEGLRKCEGCGEIADPR
ncbi:3-hydroxyanthranilic acid dioxygenase [Melampsora americana]|nr:3-hydroxyanthranilic acid dioxygenase [Melampsora americana]